jgi:hypothetical protein
MMLKAVVAYVDADMFEAVRRDLAAQGVTYLSAVAAGSATPEPFAAMHYRGSAQMVQLAEKVRVEFVVRASHLPQVKECIFGRPGRKCFMFVVDVEEALPEGSANPVLDASVQTEA